MSINRLYLCIALVFFPLFIVGAGVNNEVIASAVGRNAKVIRPIAEIASNADLMALSSSAGMIIRQGYYSAGDAQPLQYKASTSPCPLSGGRGDGGAQVPTADGRCWLAVFGSGGIDIKQFGVKCDGQADDTDRIQAALNALSEDDVNRVTFPGGTCLITRPLTIAGNSSAITGSSLYGTRILQKSLDNAIFQVPWSNVQISNFRLDYDGVPLEGADAIHTSGANNIFSELYIYRSHRGFVFEGMSGGFVHHVQVWKYINSAVFIQNAGDVYIDNFIFNADGIENGNVGLRIQNHAEAITVSNGDILGGTHSMSLDSQSGLEGQRPAYNKFSSLYFDSSSDEAVVVNNSATTSFSNVWFSGGRKNNKSGVSVKGSVGINFTGSTFFNNGFHGAEVSKSSKKTVFMNCQFVHNSVKVPGSGSGAYFEGGTTDFMVNGGVASDTGYKSTQKFGVEVGRGRSDRYTISQNLVSGNLNGGVQDLGTGKDKTISSNY